jgi:hypothetical protein
LDGNVHAAQNGFAFATTIADLVVTAPSHSPLAFFAFLYFSIAADRGRELATNAGVAAVKTLSSSQYLPSLIRTGGADLKTAAS